jgi:hypothetical protein
MNVHELAAHCRTRHESADDAAWLESIQMLEREPTNPDRFYRVAERCWQLGDVDLWQRVAQVALGLPHVTHRQRFQRGGTKLALGDWSGWLDRESRIFHPEHSSCPSEGWYIRWTKRPWDGKENIHEKTILLAPDGSHGDCLQMMRYISVVAPMAGHVILGVDPELITFAQHNFGSVVTTVPCDVRHSVPLTPRGVELSIQCHRYAWLMSLPALLGGPPPFVPLCAPQPAARRAFDHRPQVGFDWTEQSDWLAPLLDRDDMQWHRLQLGDKGDESARFETFADIANYIVSLDCVVSADTAIAHLAGTLGVRTLLILPVGADPRWGLEDTTPWYPSMRLIRQRTPGNWAGVIDELAIQLDAKAGTPEHQVQSVPRQ